MNVMVYILSAVIPAMLYFFLKKRRENKDAELSGGFDNYVGLNLKETELVRILVLEELGTCLQTGHVLNAHKTRKNRMILTSIYILTNFLILMGGYYRTATAFICMAIAVLYTYLFYRLDPVGEICTAVKKQPDRDVSQIVLEMTDEQPQKPLRPLGIAAFVLSMVLFFSINADERFVFAPADGGYNLEKYYPSVFGQEEVRIPETYQGEPVVAIGKKAFRGMEVMTRISIPETVVLIDSYAFKGCKKLDQVKLPVGLQILNGESFKGCSNLSEIVIPKGVKEIRGNTFEDCQSLQKVELHDGITDIHAYAFRNCKSLETITLPFAITEIHAYTFENCESLQEIIIPVGVTRIAAHAFYNCSALGYVHVPDTVTEIGSSAFRQCTSLKEIALPHGVAVDERAFKDSPTKLKKKLFTDEQWEQIVQEAQEKPTETVFYVYKKDAPDVIQGWNHETVMLVDDARYKYRLDDHVDLQMMAKYTEILEYLEAAKEAGFTQVLFRIYSPKASEIVGDSYFVNSHLTVDEMIEICQEIIAEESND